MSQYTNFSVSIPVKIHGELKEFAENNSRTMTSVILECLRWRLDSEKGRKHRCATGEPCSLPMLGFQPRRGSGINIIPNAGG